MHEVGQIHLPYKLFKRGKVRDVFEVDEDQLLIVSSDRISAFDYVLPSLIPDKGKILNQISVFWFTYTKDMIPNHVICDVPEKLDSFKAYANTIEKRSILTKKMKSIPVEAIVRGYIAGSGWKSYNETGEICGIALPDGLRFADQFPEPLFTPTTKADEGHDQDMTFEKMVKLFGEVISEKIKKMSVDLFNTVSQYANKKGIIIADTKFEFGLNGDGQIVLIDEIFTPDSSRFWKADEYEVWRNRGMEPPPFDKQYVRNYLLNSSWNRNSIPPELPDDVIIKTREKYLEIYNILTGETL